MTGPLVFGVLWAAAGILLGSQWWRARPQSPSRAAGGPAGETSRFGSGATDRSSNRLQAMRLAYAVGAVAVAVGLLAELTLLLVVGAALINLGTVYRYLVLALDREGLHEPLLERSGRGLLADVADRLAETA